MLKIEPGREPAEPRDAATVILVRDRAGGGFEVFMVRRHTKSGFMGGAYVFPGGKLDDEDSDARLLARTAGRDGAEAAAALSEPGDPARAMGLFVAAVRETFEEAGVLLANGAESIDAAAARAELEGGVGFVDLVEKLEVELRLDALVPWARWVTPAVEPRRFDARFFIAVAPAEQEADHDRRETTEAAWLGPREALERELAGEIQLPPPTMRTLEELAELASTAEAMEYARRRPPPLVDPVFVDEDGTWVLALPGDPRHPTGERSVPGPTRFVLQDGRWSSGKRDQ